MHIKFKLVKFEMALAFQVLEMDELYRSGKESNSIDNGFNCKNGFTVVSEVSPSIDPHYYVRTIFLRGRNTTSDLDITCKQFKNNDERDAYHECVINALKEWSENWFPKNDVIDKCEDGTFKF